MINIDSDNHAVCPLRGNTPPNRSFVYYPETESWNCFHPNCSGGDVIHLFQHLNGIPNYNEAIRKIAVQYGVPFGKVDIKHIKMEKEIQDLFKDFTEKCHNNPEFQNKYKLIEMKKRGFTQKTIDGFQVGLYNDSIKEYINKTYTKELLKNAGFISKKGYWILRNDKIVYPYLDRNGAPRYFIYRKIDKEEKK